jgi:putative nucleotidyltransferase with HDIG domain
VESDEISPRQLKHLDENPEGIFFDADSFPGYLAGFYDRGMRAAFVIPIFLEQKVAGIIAVGSYETSELQKEDLDQVKQLAGQMSVGLSNAHLIKKLEELNWGTMKALARTVDAKSPWTAGHSERVANMALEIGKELGLAHADLEKLRRGALLHDIGKIGVPAVILDKTDRLTEEEYQSIRNHPTTGVRILEPITPYADIVDLVAQHHECIDGKGYPNGLSGDDISFGARILSVADSFDAMVSDRPYRSGMDMLQAIEVMREESGKQFDPIVVTAFLKVIRKNENFIEKSLNKTVSAG